MMNDTNVATGELALACAGARRGLPSESVGFSITHAPTSVIQAVLSVLEDNGQLANYGKLIGECIDHPQPYSTTHPQTQ